MSVQLALSLRVPVGVCASTLWKFELENTQNFQDELQVDQAFSRLQRNVVMCYHIAKPTCLKENAMLFASDQSTCP